MSLNKVSWEHSHAHSMSMTTVVVVTGIIQPSKSKISTIWPWKMGNL